MCLLGIQLSIDCKYEYQQVILLHNSYMTMYMYCLGKKVDLGVLLFIIHDLISDSLSVQHMLRFQLPLCLSSPETHLEMVYPGYINFYII